MDTDLKQVTCKADLESKPSTPIAAAIDLIAGNLRKLRENMNAMEKQLTPLLGPTQPKITSETKLLAVSSGSSEIKETLQGRAFEINELNNLVLDLLDRLEI